MWCTGTTGGIISSGAIAGVLWLPILRVRTRLMVSRIRQGSLLCLRQRMRVHLRRRRRREIGGAMNRSEMSMSQNFGYTRAVAEMLAVEGALDCIGMASDRRNVRCGSGLKQAGWPLPRQFILRRTRVNNRVRTQAEFQDSWLDDDKRNPGRPTCLPLAIPPHVTTSPHQSPPHTHAHGESQPS